MKTKLLFLIALISLSSLSATTCKGKKPSKSPSEKELTELVLIQTKYGNNSEGIPTLHYAILKKDMKAIDLLLKHGADPLALDSHRRSSLYYAIKSGGLSLVKKFIAHGNLVTDIQNNDKSKNYDALLVAVQLNQYEISRHLILNSLIAPELLENSFIFLVHPHPTYAVLTREQKKDLLKIMVQYGANINAKSCSNKTPLEYLLSCDSDNTDMADFLRSLGAE